YRVVDLTPLGFTPDIEFHGSMGINNKGQAVYALDSDPRALFVPSAWVWLPEADAAYPSVAAGLNDLSTISGSGMAMPFDINESGVVVGVNANCEECGEAIAWRLATSGAPDTLLGTLPNGLTSSANAVNDDSPPLIVGTSGAVGLCACGSGGSGGVFRAFKITFGTAVGTMTALNPISGDASSYARDLQTPTGGAAALIAGKSNCVRGVPGCIPYGSVCPYVEVDAVKWGALPAPGALTDLGAAASEGRGMNDAGAAAGWGLDPEEDCPARRALYCSSAGSLTILGQTMPSGQGGDGSRAEAVNNVSAIQVVGWNETASGALLWEKPSSTWTVTDLNSYGFPDYVIPQCSAGAWDIKQAHDINDCGWIIAWGEKVSNGAEHALLLVPFGECRWDVNQDGAVNTQDYLDVIGRQGACPTSAICWWDVNDDCQVSSL
ncbi:MAG: hypothetical protein L0219_02590, partial [Phycisphaerales bacterium]|nr:hypothetical protein [Phycisphaerales bacterium]